MRLGVEVDSLHRLQARVAHLQQMTPGNFATALRALKSTHPQPSAEALLQGLEADAKINRQGHARIGFL